MVQNEEIDFLVEGIRMLTRETRVDSHNGSLEGALDFLREEQFDPEKKKYFFEIERPLSPESLERLVYFPFEVSFSDTQDGQLILYTGEKNRVQSGTYFRPTLGLGRVDVHSHPYLANAVGVNPSLADLETTLNTSNPDSRPAIIHEDGMTMYRLPTRYLDSDSIWELYGDFLVSTNRLPTCSNEAFQAAYREASIQEHMRWQEAFYDEHDVIVEQRGWDEEALIDDLVDRVFYQRSGPENRRAENNPQRLIKTTDIAKEQRVWAEELGLDLDFD